MPPVPPRRRRARPVADAPIEPLLERAETLAKGWLMALVEQAPLQDAPAILAAPLSREGPALCDAALRAVGADRALTRLEPGGPLRRLAERAGELAGARTPTEAARAVDALHGVLWSALREELRGADADAVSQLSERLSLVAEVLRAASLERFQEPSGAPAPTVAAGGPPASSRAGGPPASSRAGGPPESSRAAGPPSPPPPVASADRPPEPPGAWPADGAEGDRAPGLWIHALRDEIERSEPGSLSLLLAELEDADRVAAIETRAEAKATFRRFTGAIRSTVRPHDILVCESDARAWIIARDTRRPEALELGERVAAAVGQSPWRGAPLAASVGLAVLGEDGGTSGELIEAAEEARYAAAASGTPVSGAPSGRDGGG